MHRGRHYLPAERMTKVKGKNMPKKKRNEARTTRKKGSSLKGVMKSMMCQGFGIGGSRDFTVRLA